MCDEPLRLTSSLRWAEIRSAVASAGRIADLGRVEDEVDAVLCAYLAWLWGTGSPTMRVVGDVDSGYIVVPGSPSVPSAASDEGGLVVPGLTRKEIAVAIRDPRDDDRHRLAPRMTSYVACTRFVSVLESPRTLCHCRDSTL